MNLPTLYGAYVQRETSGKPEGKALVSVPDSVFASAIFESVILEGRPMKDRCIMKTEDNRYVLAISVRDAEELRRVKVVGFKRNGVSRKSNKE